MEPTPDNKKKPMSRVDADRTAHPSAAAFSSSGSSLGLLHTQRLGLALTGLVLLLALIGLGITQYTQAEQQRVEQAFMNAPGVKATNFQSTSFQPDAQGTIYADPKAARALVVVAGVKPLASNRVYQVWLIKGNVPTSAGTITVDAQRNGRTFVNAPLPMGNYQVVAITDEPNGGSSTPTTGILLYCQF